VFNQATLSSFHNTQTCIFPQRRRRDTRVAPAVRPGSGIGKAVSARRVRHKSSDEKHNTEISQDSLKYPAGWRNIPVGIVHNPEEA
jgi:hypothetical protein